ncbi:hypothetical protein ACJX0J_010391 [Zea mays]
MEVWKDETSTMRAMLRVIDVGNSYLQNVKRYFTHTLPSLFQLSYIKVFASAIILVDELLMMDECLYGTFTDFVNKNVQKKLEDIGPQEVAESQQMGNEFAKYTRMSYIECIVIKMVY